MYSVRRRLMWVLAVGFAVLIVGAGLYVAQVLGARVTEEFDAALLTKARALVALTEEEEGRIEFDYAPEHMSEFEREERPEYFQFWLADGLVLLRSTHLKTDLPREETPPGESVIRDVTLPDGRAGRMVQVTFVPRGPADIGDDDDETEAAAAAVAEEPLAVVLAVARGRERLDHLLATMGWTIFGAGALAVLVGALFVWRALAAGLRPLDTIAAQVGTMDAETLDARVQLPRTPRELAPIVTQLNALLDRLDASFERERRFTGNVAHELRTPIAELRSLAMVGARWPDDEASVVQFFEDVKEIAGRMEGVIADLLLLARCQAGVETVRPTPTNLREVITSTWSKVEPNASGAGLRFSMELPEDTVVESDPQKLAIVFSNVFDNAVSYSRPNSEVRCVGARAGSRLRLDITNAAEPLSAEDLASLAEPFWRKDEVRSAADHVGLGLSLVAALASLLRLDVRFDQDREGTFRVRLEGLALAAPAPLDRSTAST